ncbi:hypothetical protein [Serratia sp. 201]|uniref:hypothetical protein n=1 Tax=Serratia sp. 201 TaxID=3096764 RepID=UPI00300A83B9
MSTEKLSELSKPVAQAYYDEHDSSTMLIDWLVDSVPEAPAALYSQEYVSALQHESAVNWEAAASLNVENQELKKRIAELERANQSQDDHINQQQDRIDSLEKKNGDLGRSLGAAEKRLATPVRLPNKGDDEFWFDAVFQVAKFDRAVERAISAAGFKFVGDE